MTTVEWLAGQDLAQIVAEAGVEQDALSGPEQAQALRCGPAGWLGRGHDADIRAAAANQVPVPSFDGVEQLPERTAGLGSAHSLRIAGRSDSARISLVSFPLRHRGNHRVQTDRGGTSRCSAGRRSSREGTPRPACRE